MLHVGMACRFGLRLIPLNLFEADPLPLFNAGILAQKVYWASHVRRGETGGERSRKMEPLFAAF